MCKRLGSCSTSSKPGTSGEDDRRRSNAEFKWSRKCVGFEVESGCLLEETARRSERELGTENASGSRVGWNSANNGVQRNKGGLVSEMFITVWE